MADHLPDAETDEGGVPATRVGGQALVEILRSIPHFVGMLDGAGEALLREVEPMLAYFGVDAGTVLFREGDPAEDAYVLISGRLGVYLGEDADIGSPPIAQIGAGEVVGEMSLISGEPRSATVMALRDSDLIRVPGAAFGLMFQSSPQASLLLMRYLARRLHETSHGEVAAPAIESLALVPLAETAAVTWFGRAFIEGLRQWRPTVIDDIDGERSAEAMLRATRGLAVYVAHDPASAWARRCMRQADRVVFVAAADTAPLPRHPAVVYAETLHRAADLVLVNPADAVKATGGSGWLAGFSGDRIVHVRHGNRGDAARLGRMALGCAIGVVLSGGGARGFAHIGVYRALYEAGLPIDLAGGTSMGGLIAALIALDLDPDEVARRIHDAFVRHNPVNDYTLPVIALSRGRKLNRLLRQHYGEGAIEDLWKNFFCLSANLSTGEAVVHKTGPLWRALRASGAIPGIVPPLIEDGQVLVDGGVMNNFPTAVMAALKRGPVVGVEVTTGGSLHARESEIEERSTLWLLRHGRKQVPSILRILMRCGTVNGEAQSVASRAAADIVIQPQLSGIDMLSFQAFEQVIELGYRAGVEAVPRITELLERARAGGAGLRDRAAEGVRTECVRTEFDDA